MIDISYEKNPELYCDYKKGLEFLSSLEEEKYQYPDEITNFHIYTEVKNEKELECIKSYFATQNLKKTKLILWSDYDISDNPHIIPYKDYIDFRVYDPIKEAKGTPIEDEYEKLKATDTKHYLQSDLLRLLVLHKYGGVWVDMDIIFLRDFKPILDQEYMYQWGSETDYANQGACATVLSVKKESEFSIKLLEVLKTMPISTGGTTVWGKDLFAKLYKIYPNFTIFPSTFFNTEWLVGKTDLNFGRELEDNWFSNKSNIAENGLFLEAFSWHWHNSSNKDAVIEDGSKFDLLRKRIEYMLQKRRIFK
jgi:hypothetical protein